MLDLSFEFSDLEFYLLILMRIASFMYVAPFFSTSNTPKRVKVALSVLISIIIYQVIDTSNFTYNTVWGYSVLVLKEVLTGLIIGYGAQICSSILLLAGQISDMEAGLSMVQVMNPATRQSTTITGGFYDYSVTLILMISGLYQYLLGALVESFNLIPVTGAIFSSDKLATSMATFLCDFASIGFRLCLPVFGVMIILNGILGILAKVSPQMNMFAVGMQIKVLTGLVVLFVTVGLLPTMSTIIFDEIKKMITMFTESML